MSDNSAIEWCDSTWTPIRGVGTDRWLCQKVSPGCAHCYASTLNQNRRFNPNTLGPQSAYPEAGPIEIGTVGAPGDRTLVLDERILAQPLRWAKPRRIFVCSMTDLFGSWVPDTWLVKVFGVMQAAHQHQFLVLTKRAKRMQDFAQRWADSYGILPNVGLGVSVESQAYAWRLNYLLKAPAAVRFVSAEPLLGPLDLSRYMEPSCAPWSPLNWVIAGGESGPGYRPAKPEWFRGLRDQCQAAGVSFLFKQWGGRTPKAGGRLLDGRTWDEYPANPKTEVAA